MREKILDPSIKRANAREDLESSTKRAQMQEKILEHSIKCAGGRKRPGP